MRRTAMPAIGILGLVRIAAADPWTVTMESGAEADTNVSRVESAPRVAAAGGRLGARIDHDGRVLGGAYLVDVSGLARMVASSQTRDENVMLYAGEARWLYPLAAPSLAAGIHVLAGDSFGMLGGVGARTFRNLGADALLVLGHGDDIHLTLGVGGRDFWYKPSPTHEFDWRGPVANARFDAMLWQTPDKTQSLELAGTVGFEDRHYDSYALYSCSPEETAEDPCTMDTTLRRRDRYQRAGVELKWTGHLVATGGYQATVIDSNSFGQSLVRQRITGSVTAELFGAVFVTTTAVLQIDQYPDGILIDDLQHQEPTSLEEENRSSLQILVTRKLSAAWSLEARGAVWRDFGNGAASFRRELAYAGVVYSR
jgi:hypothetical protein